MSELKVKNLTNLAETLGLGIPADDLAAAELKNYKQHISFKDLNVSAGTWTWTIGSNVLSLVRTAAAATHTVSGQIILPIATSNSGVKLVSLVVPYTVGTAALTGAPTIVLNKVTEVADGADTGAAITQTTVFSGTNAVGTANGSYRATATINVPEYVTAGVSYFFTIAFPCDTTTVLTLKAPYTTYVGQ